MTRKKIGAVMGRPKGAGDGLDKQVAVRMKPELFADLEAMAKDQSTSPSSIIREATIAAVERWKRQKKG